MNITVKRVYEKPDGPEYRILVDRLWPRGVKKESVDEWWKDIAPSNELRKWFGHDPMKYAEFRQRYLQELDTNPIAGDLRHKLLDLPQAVLVYGAKDTEHNNALVLKEWIEKNE